MYDTATDFSELYPLEHFCMAWLRDNNKLLAFGLPVNTERHPSFSLYFNAEYSVIPGEAYELFFKLKSNN